MAKRQKRYNTLPLIRENIQDLLGKNINIVLNDGTVLFACIDAEQGDKIIVSNMRLSETKIAINDISEIILDYRG